jgi:hypothetical protein
MSMCGVCEGNGDRVHRCRHCDTHFCSSCGFVEIGVCYDCQAWLDMHTDSMPIDKQEESNEDDPV